MMKDLTHVLIVFFFMLFNVDFYVYSESHSQENRSHETSSNGLKGIRAVAFASEEAVQLLSDFKEEKIEQVNSLRNRGNHYPSPFAPPSPSEQKMGHQKDVELPINGKELPMDEKVVEIAVGVPQVVGLTGYRERSHKNEVSFEQQRPVISEVRNSSEMEEKRSDRNEDSNDAQKTRLNRDRLTRQLNQSEPSYQEEMSFGTEVNELIQRGVLEVLDQNVLETKPVAGSKDFYQEGSSLETETASTLLRAQELLNPSKTSLSDTQIPEVQEMLTPDEALMDIQSRLEALSELIFETGKAGSLEGLKRLAAQWEDAEIQDYCSENPEDPNCMRLFSVFVNRPLKTEETVTTETDVKNRASDSAEDAPLPPTQDVKEENDEEVEKNNIQESVASPSVLPAPGQENVTPASPALQMPLGHPDFYLPWERAKVGAPRFAKVDVPRMFMTVAETVPRMMARLSPQDTFHAQMEKLSAEAESKQKKLSSLSEENPFFESNLNPLVRGPAFKTVPIAPLREIRVKYVARPLMSPWMRWERFQILLEIFRPYLVSDWYWMSWILQQENQLLRNLGFKSE